MAYYSSAELKNVSHNHMNLLPPKSGNTTQLLCLSRYRPVCLEKLFLLVGLVDLDPSLSKTPSDLI